MSKIKVLLECCCGILPDDKINAVRNDLDGIINTILYPYLPFNEIAGILHRKGLIMVDEDGDVIREFKVPAGSNELEVSIGDLNDGDETGTWFKPYVNVVLKLKWKKVDPKFYEVTATIEDV